MNAKPILDPILGKMRTADAADTTALEMRVTALEEAVGNFESQAEAIIGEGSEE